LDPLGRKKRTLPDIEENFKEKKGTNVPQGVFKEHMEQNNLSHMGRVLAYKEEIRDYDFVSFKIKRVMVI